MYSYIQICHTTDWAEYNRKKIKKKFGIPKKLHGRERKGLADFTQGCYPE